MDVTSLILSSASAAQQLFEIGMRIYHRIKHEKNLNDMIRDLQIFEVSDKRTRLEVHIQIAQGVLKNPDIEQSHKNCLERQWNRIIAHLNEIDQLLDTIITNSSFMKTKARHAARSQLAAIGGTQKVSGLLDEFQDYVMALRVISKDEPPWYLSATDFTTIDPGHRLDLCDPNTFLVKGRLTDPKPGFPAGIQWFLVESKPYQQDTKEMIRENVRTLTRKLGRVQPDRGILKLVGFTDNVASGASSFHLIFTGSFDDRHPPIVLKNSLDQEEKPSLNFRLSLCYQLASAVLETQTLGLVHKNIRPENIILLNLPPTQLSNQSATSAFLSGWHYARKVEKGVTNYTNEVSIERRIYQHPERQLPRSDKEYSMAHDVYSLGVCMLEILTWESLLTVGQTVSVSSSFVEVFNSMGLQPDTAHPMEPYTTSPVDIKSVITKLNDLRTPATAGERMTGVIMKFLTSLDIEDREDDDESEDGTVSGEEGWLQGKDRREVAMQFVDTALHDLRSINQAI